MAKLDGAKPVLSFIKPGRYSVIHLKPVYNVDAVIGTLYIDDEGNAVAILSQTLMNKAGVSVPSPWVNGLRPMRVTDGSREYSFFVSGADMLIKPGNNFQMSFTHGKLSDTTKTGITRTDAEKAQLEATREAARKKSEEEKAAKEAAKVAAKEEADAKAAEEAKVAEDSAAADAAAALAADPDDKADADAGEGGEETQEAEDASDALVFDEVDLEEVKKKLKKLSLKKGRAYAKEELGINADEFEGTKAKVVVQILEALQAEDPEE